MPFEIQEELTRAKLNIPPHIWREYDAETRGRTIATEVISSRLDMIERFEREINRNVSNSLSS